MRPGANTCRKCELQDQIGQISLDRFKDAIVEAPQEEEILPLLLYRGNLTFGRAQSLFRLVNGLYVSDVQSVTDAVQISKLSSDLIHLPGLHAPLSNGGLTGFLCRLLDNPEVSGHKAGLAEYANHLVHSSGSSPHWLERIDRYGRRSRRPWRRPVREPRILKPRAIRAPQLPPPPSFWPFIVDEPKQEHDLIWQVDSAVPKGLPESVRQDVCQDLIVAVLEGKTTVENLRADAPKWIKRAWQMYPMKYGPISLDMPAPWATDDVRSFGELLEVR